MFALRFASLFLLSTTFVSASPTSADAGLAVRASTADIQTVFNTLKGSTDTILPQITSLVSGGTATDETVTPLINDLTAALDTATASLATLSPIELRKRQSDDEIAELVAGILTDVTNALDGLLGTASTIPALGGLLAGVDVSLHQVLLGLEILLAGVLNLVANLLVDVAGLLRSLALGLTLAALGL
ncbi:Sc15 protein [Mycena venus]|uniref:Sc15 protein n=1 Tax=Mycena venus TaxID=2733690 RepID=A0A8H6XSV9_9AGAR|nr:Sc15 protein [Mycena venus]